MGKYMECTWGSHGSAFSLKLKVCLNQTDPGLSCFVFFCSKKKKGGGNYSKFSPKEGHI